MEEKGRFKLSKYVIPAIISMVLVGTYTNVDGLFIGSVMGDDGLAAINFAWPIVALITSIGTGIGVGGSVLLSTCYGKNDREGAERIKLSMIVLLLFAGLFCTGALIFTYKPLLSLMGASGKVLEYGADYSFIIVLGAVFQVMGSGLVALLRNEQKTYFSMLTCVVGLVTHVVLDILLVKKYTLLGVGISTVLSQAIIMALCFIKIRVKKGTKLSFKLMPSILKVSTSPIGINFVLSLVLLFTNYFAQSVGGTEAVAAYTVTSYAVYTFDYVFQGVCDGVQPVLSYAFGAGDKAQEKKTFKTAILLLAIFSIIFVALTPLLINIMPKVFSVSATANEMMKTGFIFYAIAYPFKATVKIIGSYYYAISKTTISNLLIYVDPLVFTPLFLIILPSFWGINGVWLSMTFTQIIVAFLSILSLIIILKRERKKMEN
jgi:putative MATE family efflux protein